MQYGFMFLFRIQQFLLQRKQGFGTGVQVVIYIYIFFKKRKVKGALWSFFLETNQRPVYIRRLSLAPCGRLSCTFLGSGRGLNLKPVLSGSMSRGLLNLLKAASSETEIAITEGI